MPSSSFYVGSQLANFPGIVLHHRNMTTLVSHYSEPIRTSFKKKKKVKTRLSRKDVFNQKTSAPPVSCSLSSVKEGRELANTKVKAEGISEQKLNTDEEGFQKLPNSLLDSFYVPNGYRQNAGEASYMLPLPSVLA